MNKKRFALYLRVSTLDQNTDTQLFALKEYCQRMNLQIADEYIDFGFSGKDDKRPAFDRLLSDMRENKIDGVIVTKLDRIGRSLKHLLNLFEEFQNRGVEFISITQNINTTTPEGRMFWGLLGVFAQYERELIVARTKAGLDRARNQGKVLGRRKGSKDKKQRRKSGYFLRWNGKKSSP